MNDFFSPLLTTSEWCEGRVSDECVISKGPLHFRGWNTQPSKLVHTLGQIIRLCSPNSHHLCLSTYVPIVSFVCVLLCFYLPAVIHMSFSVLKIHIFFPFSHLFPSLDSTVFFCFSSTVAYFSSPLIVLLSVSFFRAPSFFPCCR